MYKYFHDELEANQLRIGVIGKDKKIKGFDWNLEYNYYSFDTIKQMIKDIRNTIEVMEASTR